MRGEEKAAESAQTLHRVLTPLKNNNVEILHRARMQNQEVCNPSLRRPFNA
jgi:hypothetical protein